MSLIAVSIAVLAALQTDTPASQEQLAETTAESVQVFNRRSGHVLLEITDAPLEAAEGLADSGDVIAIHQLRARFGVTLEADIEARHRELEAGHVLALMVIGAQPNAIEYPPHPDNRVWCDLRVTGRMASFGNVDCFMDLDDDGRFEFMFTGEPRETYTSLTLGQLNGQTPIDPPIAYSPADGQDLPSGQLGFRLCNGDFETGHPRFSPVLRPDGGRFEVAQACPFGRPIEPVEDNDSDANLQIDRMQIAYSVQSDDEISYRVVSRLESGPVYVNRSGEAVLPAAEAGTNLQRQAARIAELAGRPLYATGPAQFTYGLRGDDEAFARIPVRHGITGRLSNEVSRGGWFGGGSLPIGTPVYGLPFTSGGLSFANRTPGQMMWCAPIDEGDGWDVVCLPRVGQATYWYSPYNPFFAQAISFSTDTPRASTPDVERAEIDLPFGELFIEVFLLEWDRRDADLRTRICTAQGHCYGQRGLEPNRSEADGSVEIIVFGERLRLTEPGSDNDEVFVEHIRTASEDYDPTRSSAITMEALLPGHANVGRR
ncbi:MAG: hypothetical protein GYB36_02925 [Alphaproteobacteria bacterium]|nr:hypothetical protein [Alphaproteobacteria bacterium]